MGITAPQSCGETQSRVSHSHSGAFWGREEGSLPTCLPHGTRPDYRPAQSTLPWPQAWLPDSLSLTLTSLDGGRSRSFEGFHSSWNVQMG